MSIKSKNNDEYEMPGLVVKVVPCDIKKLETEAVIVGFYEDVRPLKGAAGELDWLLCGALSNLVIQGKLLGALGEVALLTSQGKIPAKKIFLLGLGPKERSSPRSLRSAARIAAGSMRGAGVSNAGLAYLWTAGRADEENVRALREGLAEGAGGSDLSVSLIAPDAATCELVSKLIEHNVPTRSS